MFQNLSFRKRIIASQIIAFMIFFAALFPIVEKVASILVKDSLIESTSELKDALSKAKTEKELIDAVTKQQYFAFFRISLINDEGLVIFDTHMGRLLGPEFKPYYHTEHSEIAAAKKKGVGYVVATSDTFGGRFAYVAETFPFQNTTYILRTAFPYNQIQDLTENFEIGVLIFSFLALLFFNAMIWSVFNKLTQPIREIIQAITPYQRGEITDLPEIKLGPKTSPSEEFIRLITAFNSLSSRIQHQIDDLKAERNEKEAILESLGEGVIAVNEKMEVLYINFIACKMLGVTRRLLIDKPFEIAGDKSNKELFERCRDLLKRTQLEGTVVTDSLSFGKEGIIFIDLIAAPKAHGTGAIIVVQDKTNHYRVLQMGKDFVANASHELRTPITIIKGFAETLHDVPDLGKEQVKEITEKIGRNCERMENLVSNLLTLADIENLAQARFQECDLISLIENCIHTIYSVYPLAEINFNKEVQSIMIRADPGLLELAIINLLENAVKYSDPHPHIIIQLQISIDEEAIIKIQDQGKGIPPEDLDHIFERFYRVDKTHSRRLGGAGLGLSIVKTIITKHDGVIEVQSKLGEGTVFTITLPLRHHERL